VIVVGAIVSLICTVLAVMWEINYMHLNDKLLLSTETGYEDGTWLNLFTMSRHMHPLTILNSSYIL